MTIIIGAGLSGLLTAYLLQKEGFPFKILEARNRVGGRIHTLQGVTQTPVEMGATWFTGQHIHLIKLLQELEMDFFQQQMGNTVFYQASSYAPTQRIQIPLQAPSYRISGGTSAVIHKLLQKIDKNNVYLNQPVQHIKIVEHGVEVQAQDIFEGNRLILALPPKLWAKNIAFEPNLPSHLMQTAEQTHTWMEDSIKIALSYKAPFWEQDDIPSTLFSNAGPITELYDHCNQERSKYALCGFINSSLKSISFEERRERVIHQLNSIFGPRVKEFTDYEECLWSKEEYTYKASEDYLRPHQNNGNPIFNTLPFGDKLIISSAETASSFPGYMDGAVSSAKMTLQKIKK